MNNKKGLSDKIKEKLIQQMLNKAQSFDDGSGDFIVNRNDVTNYKIEEKFYKFKKFDTYKQILAHKAAGEKLKLESPFFRVQMGIASATVVIDSKKCINFASYNYLGLNGDQRVSLASKLAIDKYGTTVSGSRLVSGEIPLHRELESELAKVHGVEDCIVFVSGHATNVTTIGYLFGSNDLILYDSLSHNSIIQGALLSGASRKIFPHNDFAFIDEYLASNRDKFEKVLIVIEGLYSMDGDIPDLPNFIKIKEKYKALLMVDEAHSFGVLGPKGHGVASHFAIDPKKIDIHMGTLSKSMGSVGGYIAGSYELVEILHSYAPGFLYSVGMAPASTAAALEALHIMQKESKRIKKLQDNSLFFLQELKKHKINTGLSSGFAVIPVIVGSSIKAVRLANALFEHGIRVQPIIYPAVEEKLARIRFFVSSEHVRDDMLFAINILIQELKKN